MASLIGLPPTAHRGRLPAVIRRNTILLATTQAFVGIGNQMIPTLGALIVVNLLGSATFTGLASSIQNVSRFAVAYPIGWVADRFGRRAALLAGYVIGLTGALVIGTSVIWSSFPLFVLGMLIFGIGVGAGQQLRLAAADLFPPSRRAEGLGYVLTGSLVGALGGPVLISAAQGVAPGFGLDPLAMAWLLVPAVLIPGMGLVFLVRPDPREIAKNLALYYPEAMLRTSRRPTGQITTGVGGWLNSYPLRVAFVTTFATQGTMTLMMSMTALALSHHGHELPAISLAVAIHVLGMFSLSLPLGRLTDRIGRRNVLMIGTGISALGTIMVVATGLYWPIALGIFLVGLGWSCSNVAASALIADLIPPGERGRAIGINDTFSTAGSILLPLLGGPLVELFGLPILAVVGCGLLVVPFGMLLPLREASPGHFPDLALAR
jgi:MFS family permease